MDELSDHPLASFVNALNSVIGRVILGLFSIVGGAFLGGATGTGEFLGGVGAIMEIHSLIAASLFFSVGIVVIPGAIAFVVIFARTSWPLWLAVVPALLFWWNFHQLIHWTLNEGPGARMRELETQIREASNKAADEMRKELKKPAEKE